MNGDDDFGFDNDSLYSATPRDAAADREVRARREHARADARAAYHSALTLGASPEQAANAAAKAAARAK